MGFSKFYSMMFFIALSSSAFGADDKTEKKAPTGAVGGVVVNESLQRMIEIKGVKPIYEKCDKSVKPNSDISVRGPDVFNCLWEVVKKDEKLKEQVLKAYKEETKKIEPDKETQLTQTTTLGRAPASSSSESLISKNNNVANDYGADPSVKALSDFFGKKLDEILNPSKGLTKDEIKNGVILTVDHKKFIDLYKSELGKTIVSAFTSYCIDTDPEKYKCSELKEGFSCKGSEVIIDEDSGIRKGHRDENIKSLKIANLDGNSKESAKWQYCISQVTPNCKADNSSKESSKRACLIVDYVQAAKQNIIVADRQLEDYKLLGGSTANLAENMKEVSDLNKTSSDSLLELTSKDVKDSLKDSHAKTTKEFEACYKDDKIVDAEACKKFLNTNTDENAKALVELQMRQEMQQEKLETALKSDDTVKEYLKQEGFETKEIESLTKDKGAVENARKEIMDRFKAQKDAIIKEMAAKIQKTVSTENGKITNSEPDKTKLEKIGEELKNRKDDLANLVQFNNIVSSYISISDSKGKSAGRNTASLFAETNSMEAEASKVLIKNRDAAKLTDQKGKSTSVDLNVKTINEQLIDYEFQGSNKEAPKP